MKLKEKYLKIWQLSEKYQDSRNDKGHTESVVYYALKLLKIEKGDKNIVIPAAILHDIGWSKMSKRRRFLFFDKNTTKKEKYDVKKEHEKLGVKLAKELLEKVNYDKELIVKITKIIDGHDTRLKQISKEDEIVKDADKLWRFSKKGMEADIKRFGVEPEERCNKMKIHLKQKDFLFTKTAKQIAKKELEKRRKELGL